MQKHLHFPYAIPTIEQSMGEKAAEAVNIYFDTNVQEFKNIEYAEQDIKLDLGDGIIVNGKMDVIKKKNQEPKNKNKRKTKTQKKETEDQKRN